MNGFLLSAIFLKRYKRFLADVMLEGDPHAVQVHCPNSGSMLSLLHDRCQAYVIPNNNSSRKTRFTLELLCIPSGKRGKKAYVCVNTHRANHVAFEALRKKRITLLADYNVVKREPSWNNSALNLKGRFDILLENSSGRKAFVEVKSVTMVRETSIAEFPDAITTRGTKHLKMLRDVCQQGHFAILLFIVQRDDCNAMRIAQDIDLTYAQELIQAQKEGVQVLSYRCMIDPKAHDWVTMHETIPLLSS